MPSSRRRRSVASTARTLSELGVAVPQVVTHRVLRLALAGPVLSRRDQKEFSGMVLEKQIAIVQSWQAMLAPSLRLQGELMSAWMRALAPATPAARSSQARALSRALGEAALAVADQGLRPVHRKATANARRLARTKLR
jgi:hypothetical protein